MLTEEQAVMFLKALSDAGLCVCEKRLIEPHDSARCGDEWVIGRLEESGGTQ